MHLIRCNNITFYVFPAPSNENIDEIINILKNDDIFDIVHLIEINYDKNKFINTKFHNLIFEDGGYPDDILLIEWFKLLDYFNSNLMKIGIHCKASLGRAPLLITIALIYYGFTCEDAILYIRNIIKNAINTNQINYLNKKEKYIKQIRKMKLKRNKCIIC